MVTMALSAKRQVILLGELCRQHALFPRNEVRVRLAHSAHSGPPVDRRRARSPIRRWRSPIGQSLASHSRNNVTVQLFFQAHRVGSEIPVSRCTLATVRALGGIILRTTCSL